MPRSPKHPSHRKTHPRSSSRPRASAASKGAVTAVLPSGETLPVPWSRQDLTTSTERAAVDRLFDAIPEDEMRCALELAAVDNVKIQRFVDMQSDAAYSKHSTAARLRAADITPKIVVQALLDLHNADADLRVARRLPGIMEHMASESAPRMVDCPDCSTDLGIARRVSKKLSGPKRRTNKQATSSGDDGTCRTCGGIGKVTLEADNEVRKMLLELAGKLGSRGPLVDARQLHITQPGASVGAPDLTEFCRATDDAFEEKGTWKLGNRRTSPPSLSPPPPETPVPEPVVEATIVETANQNGGT